MGTKRNKKTMTLNGITAAVLDTLKYDLFDIKPSFENGMDWKSVYRELGAQGIRCFSEKTLDYIIENGILEPDDKNAELIGTWRKKIARQKEITDHVAQVQQKFVSLLQEKGVKFAILKGFAASYFYRDYSCRRSGDVDFLVLPERFDEIHKTLVTNGFECTVDTNPRHNCYSLEGVEFEMHRMFSYEDTPESKGKSVNERFFENLDHPEILTVNGFSFPSLSIENIGICFLVHQAHHLLNEGIGFRHFLDWVVFADSYLSDDCWNQSFGKAAGELGLAPLAAVMTKTAQLYFGLPTENRTWCAHAEDQVCADLLYFMQERGNYSIEKPETRKYYTLMYGKKPKDGVFATLQYRGEINWAALKKHPKLRPFAWIYQICRFVKRTVAEKNSVSQFHRARSQKRVLERLSAACGLKTGV